MKKISRRQLVLGLGAAGTSAALAPLAAQKIRASATKPNPTPTCTVSAEQTEGPFYFDTKFIRKDITEGKPGEKLHLKLKIVDAESCSPVRDAVVDIWSCDAAGVYSGYESVHTESGAFRAQQGDKRDNSKHANDNRPRFHQEPNTEEKFLRGAQVTNEQGEVEFLTIYPGWYPGRATHIHVKVYLDDSDIFTSQMYFPETLNERVHAGEAYNSLEKAGEKRLNKDDGIFKNSGSNNPMVEITETEDGFVGTLTFGVSPA